MGCGTLLNIRYNEFMKKAAACMNRNIPLYIIGTGFEPVNFDGCVPGKRFYDQGEVRRDVLTKVIHYAKYVGVRGPQSRDMLVDLTRRADIEVCGDFAFLLRGEPDFKFRERHPKDKIVLNFGKTWGYLYGNSEKDAFDSYRLLVRELSKDFEVIVVPFWFDDIEVSKELCLGLDRVRVLSRIPDDDFLIEILNDAFMVVGFKLHSLVIPACLGICFVPIAYRPKTVDFLKSIGYDDESIIKLSDKGFVRKVLDVVERHKDSVYYEGRSLDLKTRSHKFYTRLDATLHKVINER